MIAVAPSAGSPGWCRPQFDIALQLGYDLDAAFEELD